MEIASVYPQLDLILINTKLIYKVLFYGDLLVKSTGRRWLYLRAPAVIIAAVLTLVQVVRASTLALSSLSEGLKVAQKNKENTFQEPTTKLTHPEPPPTFLLPLVTSYFAVLSYCFVILTPYCPLLLCASSPLLTSAVPRHSLAPSTNLLPFIP